MVRAGKANVGLGYFGLLSAPSSPEGRAGSNGVAPFCPGCH